MVMPLVIQRPPSQFMPPMAAYSIDSTEIFSVNSSLGRVCEVRLNTYPISCSTLPELCIALPVSLLANSEQERPDFCICATSSLRNVQPSQSPDSSSESGASLPVWCAHLETAM